MPQYLVYETEYPEEGSILIEAQDKEAARAEWMRITNTTEAEEPVLSIDEATTVVLEQRRALAIHHIGQMALVITQERMDHFREAIAEFQEVDGALMKMGA
jgi:hypothetical protein